MSQSRLKLVLVRGWREDQQDCPRISKKWGLGDTRKQDDGLRKTIPTHHYLLDWYDSGKCCADPPVMSQTGMTKGPSVFFSDNMRSLNHTVHICWLSQIRRCANLRSRLILPMWSCLRVLSLKNTEGPLVIFVWDMTGGSAQHFPLSYQSRR